MSRLLSSHLSTETSLAGSVPKAAFKCQYTLFILFKLLHTAETLACMPIYIVRKGYNAIGVGRGAMSKMLTGWMDGWMDTP